MFGKGKKRVNLVKEMITHRMIGRGYGNSEIQGIDKYLGRFTSLSFPEGTIIVIIQEVLNAHRQGVASHFAFERIEKRRRIGTRDESRFQEIMELSINGDSALALIEYCYYRISIEDTKGSIPLTKDEVSEAVAIAWPEVSSW